MTTNNQLNSPEPFGLLIGGTNASLTASNGGIFYSTATAAAILAGTATANQIILSGNLTTPTWSTATYPATTTINQLLYSSSNNVIVGLATGNSGVLITSGGGIPSISSTLPSAVQTNITALGTQAQALNMGAHLINNIVDPVSAQDAATKNYVDSGVAGAVLLSPSGPQIILSNSLTLAAGIFTVGTTTGGVNGALVLYPNSASAGGFRIFNNTVSSFSTTFTNSSVGQTTTITIPDPGVAAANVALEVDGTFTPTMTCASPGDLSVAYANQTGVYAKIGNLVTVNVRLQFTPTFITASGEVQFAGLPFPVQGTNGIGWCGSISFMSGGFVWPVGVTCVGIIAEAAGSFCGMWGTGSAINSSPLLMSGLTTGVQYHVVFTVTYKV